MLRPIEANRLSDYAVQQLIGLIRSGELKPNQQLPVEQELADQLGVSRASVREAMRVLETLGYVDAKRGKGVYVRGQAAVADELVRHWGEYVTLYGKELADLYQLRHALEVEAATLAAERATDEEISSIRTCLRRMEVAADAGNLAMVVACDVEFHALISKASGNELLQRMNESIAHMLEENRAILLGYRNRQRQSLKDHTAILDAIERRDPKAAARAMSRHVRGVLALLEQMARKVT